MGRPVGRRSVGEEEIEGAGCCSVMVMMVMSVSDGEKEVVLLLICAVPYAAFVQTANMASKASLGGLPLSVQRAVTISPSRTVSTRSVDGLPAEEANKRDRQGAEDRSAAIGLSGSLSEPLALQGSES